MKKFVAVLSLALLGGNFARAQAPAPAPSPDAPAADPVIITGEGVSVTQAEFERALAALPPEYQEYAKGPGKRSFAADFLRMKVLAAAGAKAGLENDPEVVRELAMMRSNFVARAMLRRIEEGVQLNDDDLRKTYEARKSDFTKAKARHILIAFKGSPAAREGKPELTEAAAEAKAQELRTRIVEGKAKFEDLAKSESDDTGSGANGGDLGEFGRGQMVPEFEKAIFEAEAGKLPPVIRTTYGYHILRVDSFTTTPFEEAKADLDKQERAAKVQAELGKLVDSVKPVYDPAYFGK